jgi:hypothetical protein
MQAHLDRTDFVDTDYSSPRSTPGGAAPARPDLDEKVAETQQQLAALREQQERLERERAQLEEARRRQIEFTTGREEMIRAMTRGIGLLEQAEMAARRDADSMARSLAEFRQHLLKVNALDDQSWKPERWNAEITAALTTIENARMEWNGARIKFPLLDRNPDDTATAPAKDGPGAVQGALFATTDFAQLCRIGFALTWPVLLGAIGVIVALFLRG